MPLPPLPDNNTVRYWLKYLSVGVEHEMMVRLPDFAVAADALGSANGLAQILKTRMVTTDSVTGLRYSPAGSSFSVPIPFTAVVGTLTASFWLQDPESVQLSFTGRSFVDGRKVTYEFFTAQQTTSWPGDNRYNPGDSAPIDTFRENFVDFIENGALPAQQAVTIGGSIPTMNAYVNIRSNAYWQNAQR